MEIPHMDIEALKKLNKNKKLVKKLGERGVGWSLGAMACDSRFPHAHIPMSELAAENRKLITLEQ